MPSNLQQIKTAQLKKIIWSWFGEFMEKSRKIFGKWFERLEIPKDFWVGTKNTIIICNFQPLFVQYLDWVVEIVKTSLLLMNIKLKYFIAIWSLRFLISVFHWRAHCGWSLSILFIFIFIFIRIWRNRNCIPYTRTKPEWIGMNCMELNRIELNWVE